MANSCHAVTQRWVDRIIGTTTRNELSNPRVPIIGGNIHSFGSHFEMARPLRDKKGIQHSWLLNGDRFSVTTDRHQQTVRDVLKHTGLPMVIIPHDALRAAGVDRDSIQLIDVNEDRFEKTEHVTYEKPESAEWVEVPIEDYVDLTDTGTRRVLRFSSWQSGGITVEALPDGRTRYSWTTSQHFLGESLIRARTEWRSLKSCKPCKSTGRLEEFRGMSRRELPWNGPDWRCPTCHGAGEIRTTHHRWSYYLSGFDMHESPALYFFCELPRGVKPTTVAEAYEALKPEPVKLAEQMGRTVARQGDIFAIPVVTADKRSLRKQGARFAKRGTLLNQNHEGSEVAYLPDGTTLVRGVLWHNPEGRRPDHRRVRLSPGWHVVIKNTCPLAA